VSRKYGQGKRGRPNKTAVQRGQEVDNDYEGPRQSQDKVDEEEEHEDINDVRLHKTGTTGHSSCTHDGLTNDIIHLRVLQQDGVKI
jgi:hypothetical protein